MSENKIILRYQGPIEFKTTEILLQKVKNDLEKNAINKVIKKRVYNIMVECIENVLKHHEVDPCTKIHPYIILEKFRNQYLITAGNLISNDEVSVLKQKLYDAKHKDKASLLKMYENQINKENILLNKGAGLGIITIALKANSNFDYSFSPVNKQSSIYELKVSIPF
ncbi:hypothetical protein SAMN06265379_101393 [Saccharicrinis carchari]|uniref:Histidine kinase-, DNA gyrase B-, and HSP90-like ATPase n=1 Tax=Saccharicrinis carchari TaxID=1168039 RepID=A0A521ATA5_SACCC|nr:SiaB family protein kinase [Saccharicrinis carchari]SMO38044.1 hypothetical protein SAMN06265379_101393 [Saccharicrinis carchari]